MDDCFKKPSETVWLDVYAVKSETDKAMLLETDVGEVWIPKSQMKARRTNNVGQIERLEIPRWLADGKGLINIQGYQVS